MAILGVFGITGILRGHFYSSVLLAYTVQSNILVMLFMLLLFINTTLVITNKRKPADSHKFYSFYPRISMMVTLAIFVTMLVT
jgi:hypothetical protein